MIKNIILKIKKKEKKTWKVRSRKKKEKKKNYEDINLYILNKLW